MTQYAASGRVCICDVYLRHIWCDGGYSGLHTVNCTGGFIYSVMFQSGKILLGLCISEFHIVFIQQPMDGLH